MCQSTFCTTLEIYSFDIGHKGGLQASKKKMLKEEVRTREEDKFHNVVIIPFSQDVK